MSGVRMMVDRRLIMSGVRMMVYGDVYDSPRFTGGVSACLVLQVEIDDVKEYDPVDNHVRINLGDDKFYYMPLDDFIAWVRRLSSVADRVKEEIDNG